jgi:hypothetical protein
MPSTSPALSAKLIFPTKEIVEEYYLPIIYTACRTCYSEQVPDQDLGQGGQPPGRPTRSSRTSSAR